MEGGYKRKFKVLLTSAKKAALFYFFFYKAKRVLASIE